MLIFLKEFGQVLAGGSSRLLRWCLWDCVDAWSRLRVVLGMWNMLGWSNWQIIVQVANWSGIVRKSKLLR